jgi:alkylation response protein AidB-like acyl-CoA dehydrogenase
VAASNPPPISFEGRESQLEIRGNPHPKFARKSTSQLQFPANPIAAIPAISIANQSLRDISRTTGYAKEYHVERLFREVSITRLAPITEQLILSFIAEKVLELPKSY